MFNGINKVILIGYVGADPEIVNLSNKKNLAKITLSTSSSWKDSITQEWIKRTEWHQLVFYNKIDLIEKYLKKGSKIYVEGSLKTDKVEKNGTFVYFTKIICNNLLLLNNGKETNKTVDEELSFFEDSKNVKEEDEEDIPF